MAALLLLERLTPLERAIFVLREVFGFSFPEIASAVGRSEAACRQLAVRARRHMDAGRPRYEGDRREREELAELFFDIAWLPSKDQGTMVAESTHHTGHETAVGPRQLSLDGW